jgi:hypothetical protein
MRASLSLIALVSIAALGCNAQVHLPDASADAASQPDSSAMDSASAEDASAAMDASAEASSDDGSAASDSAASDASADAQSSDAGPSNTEILGTLFGSCGVLRPLITSPMPSLVSNQLVFMAPERYERAALSMGGQRLFDTPNAGGSSIESEIMAYEVLHFCEGASLTATETEIQYTAPDDAGANSITDLLVTIDGQRVGVSVTRIYRPAPMVLTDADVRSQLVTKLTGINRSSMRVLPAFRWVKQVLSVFVANQTVADQVARVWPTIDAATRADTIVLMTATRGGGFIYCNPDPALGTECPSL